jgi:hypothetical protein
MNSLYNSVFGGGNQAQSYQSQGAMTAAQNTAAQYNYTKASSNAQVMRDSGKITGDIYSPITCRELEHPAYEAPVAFLIDMWLARFGNDWVDIETVDNDDFFRLAFKRLKAMGELEVHYLTDRARYVCRKPK